MKLHKMNALSNISKYFIYKKNKITILKNK